MAEAGPAAVRWGPPVVAEDGGVWVFAYGSLMWRPGFAFLEVRPARLHGYHRALCIYSIRGRGTAEKPGLVLGLDRGGACVGLAYRTAAADWEAIAAYLDSREMITGVYRPTFLAARLNDGRRVPAYVFIVRRDHAQYTGRLSEERIVELVRQGVGPRGTSREYLESTVRHLDDLDVREPALRRILRKVDGKG